MIENQKFSFFSEKKQVMMTRWGMKKRKQETICSTKIKIQLFSQKNNKSLLTTTGFSCLKDQEPWITTLLLRLTKFHDHLDFAKSRRRFGVSWTEKDSNLSDLKLKLFRKYFGLSQNNTMGESSSNQGKRLKNPLINAAEKFRRDELFHIYRFQQFTVNSRNDTNLLKRWLTLCTDQAVEVEWLYCDTS